MQRMIWNIVINTDIRSLGFKSISTVAFCRDQPLFCRDYTLRVLWLSRTFGTYQTIIITMALINPQINFNGNAEEAFTFYKSVFGGEFAKVIRFKDIASSEFPVAEKEENKIMHISLPIGKSNMLMGNDVPESMGRTNENENRSKIVIIGESKEEADKLFNGLSVGGQIEGPIGDSPWGTYFGCFRDKYGIEWIVEYDRHYKGEI